MKPGAKLRFATDWAAQRPGLALTLSREGADFGDALDALSALVAADMDRIVMPGMTLWQHPRFFGYFPANVSPPGKSARSTAPSLDARAAA